ncbi:MAG: histidine kinase [Lachnospiraceae bacterium]|nr:histidine kinase [Lachnospiraceae bacterium]
MKKHAFFDSIYTKFMFQLILLIFTPLALVGIIFSYVSHQNTQNQRYAFNDNVNASMINNINAHLESVAQITQSLLSSSELTSFLKNTYDITTDYNNYISSIQNYVEATINANSRSDLFIYMENSSIPMSMDVFFHLSDIKEVSTIQDFLESDFIDCWLCESDFTDISNPYLFPVNDRFIYLRKAYDFKKSFLGILVFSIPESYVLSFDVTGESTVMADGHTRIINLSGETLSQKELDKILSMNTSYAKFGSLLAAQENPKNFPFTIITVTKNTDYSQLILGFLLLLICFAFLCILLCLKNLRQLMKQMHQCLSAMDTSISNNYKTRIPVIGNNEITDISHRINDLLNQAEYLAQQNIKKETSNKETRLIALQHQINPHFIYNTMEVFSSKMKIYGHYDESDAMVAFANIFRYNISTNDALVRIHEELRQSHNYMDIQKLRYPEIRLQADIPIELSFALIPKFTFQPIIENAISHGLKNAKQELLVHIQIEKQGDFLTISIKDNGCGMLPKQLDTLMKSLSSPENIATNGRSVGLKNVHSRLVLYFGESAGLRIESRHESYTIVSFKIPFITKQSAKTSLS